MSRKVIRKIGVASKSELIIDTELRELSKKLPVSVIALPKKDKFGVTEKEVCKSGDKDAVEIGGVYMREVTENILYDANTHYMFMKQSLINCAKEKGVKGITHLGEKEINKVLQDYIDLNKKRRDYSESEYPQFYKQVK